MTKEQILTLAKTCGFEELIGERDDETDGVYYQFWEDQLLKFAERIYEKGKWEGEIKGYYNATGGRAID